MLRTFRSNVMVRFVAWMLPAVGTIESVASEPPRLNASFPPASATVLRLARSNDGLTFRDTGEVFLAHAAAPDLVVLRNGHALALFDHADGGMALLEAVARGRTVLAVSRSKDNGRSWSPSRPIRLRGVNIRSLSARHGELVRLPRGRLRLYFTATVKAGRGGQDGHANEITLILSAITRNGLSYRLDGRTRIPMDNIVDPHPMIASLNGRVHLYVAGANKQKRSGETPGATLRHSVSRDGRRFARLRPSRTPDVSFRGSIVATDRGLRAYVSAADGIRSLISRDGRDWEMEPGVRLLTGWDPAVVRLTSGSYLMLYCSALDKESPASSQLVAASLDLQSNDGEWAIDDLDTTEEGTAAGVDEGANADAVAQDELGRDGTDSRAEDEDVVVVTAGEEGPELLATDWDADIDQAGDWLDHWDSITSGGFAPKPNFKTKVDYLAWYREYALDHPVDNAYDAYAAFIPDPRDQPGSKPEWPAEIHGMFSGTDYDGPPAPWDPAQHPEWEASNRALQSLLEQYREASKHDGYAAPLKFDKWVTGVPDGEALLVDFLLPSLSAHRTMAKATLDDAWRKENGKVSSQRMLEAWQTILRSARHLERGATLIEDLVSTAERAQVQETARWALKHEVFSADELETALDTLREYDRSDEDPARSLRGEHAMAMDITQHLFSPPTPDGEPQINMKRAEAVNDLGWTESDMLEQYARMGPEDAYATLDAFDNHYRELAEQMRIGYPDVRAADIEALEQETLHTGPVTQMILPGLSRYYTLKTREEASRRATQLAYATRLFKAKNGQFPQSLDELPVEYGLEMRTDPFTGENFGYRLTDDGPRIYSLSENGIDDGGVHSPRWNDEIRNDAGSDDHVFWPPQPR